MLQEYSQQDGAIASDFKAISKNSASECHSPSLLSGATVEQLCRACWRNHQ
ncbi:hypothetical protein [Leptolyngbya sp. FACHB-671]|uniref:hypothetical protein n=1 Tax=Leptolyngbya sp. FACHB-671 TaxID=2692812 RepID=UPI001F558BD5|nr:hypothetical protein [Leptolyngbya sp. FACHB-671]